MVKWIVLAVLLFGVAVLLLAVRSVLVRLPALDRASRVLLARQADVEAVAVAAAGLEQRVAALGESSALAERRLAVIRARRGGAGIDP